VLVALALAVDQPHGVLLVLPEQAERSIEHIALDVPAAVPNGGRRALRHGRLGLGADRIDVRALLEQFPQPRRPRGAPAQQIVRDLEEEADADGQPVELGVLEQPQEDLLRQFLGHIRRGRLPQKAVDALVVQVEETKNPLCPLMRLGHAQLL
jgi:hypothetical protein